VAGGHMMAGDYYLLVAGCCLVVQSKRVALFSTFSLHLIGSGGVYLELEAQVLVLYYHQKCCCLSQHFFVITPFVLLP
jgi:hypothetical protein